MTVALDHDGNPFFAGTYFPDRPRGGQPSLRQVLGALSEAWRDRPDDVRRAAGSVREHLARDVALSGDALSADDLDGAVAVLAGDFDPERGGFGGAPKFPPSMVLELLRRRADEPSQRMLDRTLEAMARGGIHDQLGGGFARYSVDAGWVVPHFEKMLYDNAQLVGLYARWGTPLGARVAADTADWMLRELATPEGGFASALDADSEGEEGRFYVWTPDQLADVLGAEDGAWAVHVFEVTGTFEHGTSTLQLLRDPDDPDRLDDVRRRLLAAREGRVRPARDDKVVAAWNGLAIAGLVDAGRLLGREEYVDAARRAGDLLAGTHLVDGRLRRVSRDGRVGSPAGVPSPVASWPCAGRPATSAGWPTRRVCSTTPSPASEPTTAASSTPRSTASDWWSGLETPVTTPARRASRPRSTPCSRRTRSPARAAGSRRRRRPSPRWPC